VDWACFRCRRPSARPCHCRYVSRHPRRIDRRRQSESFSSLTPCEKCMLQEWIIDNISRPETLLWNVYIKWQRHLPLSVSSPRMRSRVLQNCPSCCLHLCLICGEAYTSTAELHGLARTSGLRSALFSMILDDVVPVLRGRNIESWWDCYSLECV